MNIAPTGLAAPSHRASSVLVVGLLAIVTFGCGDLSDSALTAGSATNRIGALCQELELDFESSAMRGSDEQFSAMTGDEWRVAARQNGVLAEIATIASGEDLAWAGSAYKASNSFAAMSDFAYTLADLLDDGEDLEGPKVKAEFEKLQRENADFDGRDVAAVWNGLAEVKGCGNVRDFVQAIRG